MDPAGITQTIGLVKQAIKAASSLTNLEIKDALIAAREALNDQRETNLALRDELHELREKNADLVLEMKKNQQIIPGVDCYEKILDDGKKFAICTKCWESESAAITLQKLAHNYPNCPNCKNYYTNVQDNSYINLPHH